MLSNVTDTFADGKVIVLINSTNTLELGFLEDYDDLIDAAMYIGATGQSQYPIFSTDKRSLKRQTRTAR